MEGNKVISSNITRDLKPIQNNLYDLIAVKPATPTSVSDVKEHTCDFKPVIGKIYTPKKRIRYTKVMTVRDIRNLFETDISTDLFKDLEKQHNILLKKITCGSSREENTRSIAQNLVKCDKPVSRSAWQMVMNVNPEGHPHAIQYVLWNGRRIRVNGSKGGKSTFLCNYDLASIKIPTKKETKRKSQSMKKGLLQNSLSIKFKPGPLSRKKSLDDSFQKYNVGKTELVNLPKPGLDVHPVYGVALEPMIANFVQSLRECNGAISKKWAEFAVSVVGTVKNNEPVQTNVDSGVTFELNYRRDQRRMMLRRDVNKTVGITKSETVKDHPQFDDVESILKEMLDSVEISLQQDNMYTGEDEPREQPNEENLNVLSATKEKSKKRCSELDKLDVTVIRLPDIAEDGFSTSCKNAYCSLGCICASLQRSYHIKQHCSRVECMFECKCDFSKYKIVDTLDSDCPELIPGLINLDNKLSLNLAKEEQKFHQTVVLTGDKSILLKSERRNWKATKRYVDFYENMCLKTDMKSQRILSVADVKLNFQNVEPWCMVHNLYKCFCKGKFTQSAGTNAIDETEINETISHEDEEAPTKHATNIKDKKHRSERYSVEKSTSKCTVISNSEIIDLDAVNFDYSSSARTKPYRGRKFYDAYYLNTNKKILEMEKNDDHLRKRMLSILSKSDDSDASNQSCASTLQSCNEILQSQNSIESNDEISSCGNITEPVPVTSANDGTNRDNVSMISPIKDNVTPDRSILNTNTNKTKLIAWLESSYKQYKQRIEQGIVKKSLEPPKHGKVALYPWEFILSRYRERKNLFLISQQKPFRIFMAVDGKNSFFENCINIDDIRFADLHKYPVTVKNLLTNATDLKDNFCILCGLSLCWELIGSVTKLDDQTNDTNQLQRVADDKKIGFIAQDNLQVNKIEKPKQYDNIQNDVINAFGPASDNKNSKKKGKKRRRFGRRTHSKKIKAATNIVQESSQDKKQDSNNESEDDCSSTIDNDEEQSSPLEQCENTIEEQSIRSVDVPNPETEVSKTDLLAQEMSETETDLNLQSSKWFVMTVENDFSEIQFYNRGFFVKYESIIKAINVARMSGKTVRLSSQKGSDQSTNCPQFGIYAIPNSYQYYVFIGPYDKDEPLGIETVKSFADIRKNTRTRGVWITTKKVDNVKVIDNPLSFMPNILNTTKVFLENDVLQDQSTENDNHVISSDLKTGLEKSLVKHPIAKNTPKIVKPIKIRKANGFYQLAPQGFLAQVLPKCQEKSRPHPLLVKSLQNEMRPMNMPMLQLPLPNLYPKQKPFSLIKSLKSDDCLPQSSKPVAEIAPQIKILDVYSETAPRQGSSQSSGKKSEGSMFILKPEEINKRLMENRLTSNSEPASNSNVNNVVTATDLDQDQDIENFLATSTVYEPPNADIFEISDDDDDQDPALPNWRNVWIECETAPIGYMKGRKTSDNMLSFEFPGFKFTEFYPEEEALSKINQVLSRKVYVPKSIKLKWRVVESQSALKTSSELKVTSLGPDIVLTKRGLRHKLSLLAPTISKSLLKTAVDTAIDKMNEMEEQSKMLEDEGEKMLSEMVAQIDRTAILESLSLGTEEAQDSRTLVREQLSKTLQDITSSEISTSDKT